MTMSAGEPPGNAERPRGSRGLHNARGRWRRERVSSFLAAVRSDTGPSRHRAWQSSRGVWGRVGLPGVPRAGPAAGLDIPEGPFQLSAS